jgi:ABC-type polysaccharide/polyol phosphate transport system ATPase subunit
LTGGESAISLRGVGKRYWKLEEQAMLLKSILPFWHAKKTEMWALRGIDIEVGRGETVGLLGRNGAGKTSLLRLLAGVSQPSEGTLRVVGRIAPLISVGVGFNREMSGRENVYLNGMLLGLTRDQIEARFDDIVAFAELPDFIDTPVKFYSSGMFMRLGFAVAIHVEPQVLLVDEVLAVGDLAFQLKCFDRMREIQKQGTTIVIVSHSMHAIRLLCPRAMVMRKGALVFDGGVEDAIARHHELLSAPEDTLDLGQPIRVLGRELIGPNGPSSHLTPGEQLHYRARLRFDKPVSHPQVWFSVLTEDGVVAYSCFTPIGKEWREFAAGEDVAVDVDFRCGLAGGSYRMGLIVTDRQGEYHLLSDTGGMLVYVAPVLGTVGVAELEGRIAVDGLVRGHESVLLDSDRRDAAAESEEVLAALSGDGPATPAPEATAPATTAPATTAPEAPVPEIAVLLDAERPE